MKKLKPQKLIIGCDPEFFFRENGNIIGAEKVLPPEPLIVGKSQVIIDGVQGELNPRESMNGVGLAKEIMNSFRKLKSIMKQGVEIDFAQTVLVTQAEMDSLSDKSKRFGCAPSKSASGAKALDVDATKYLYRSAGGHVHLGFGDDNRLKEILSEPEIVVSVLDVLVANTCVMVDRSEGNIERRKVYGRAGEYRTPKHGLEYRTLSNFWLSNSTLMSMVVKLVEQAVAIVDSGQAQELLKLVKKEDIVNAINYNDIVLARDNFEKIRPFIESISGDHFVLNKKTIPLFMKFVDVGKDACLGDDPIEHWVGGDCLYLNDFVKFLLEVVNKY